MKNHFPSIEEIKRSKCAERNKHLFNDEEMKSLEKLKPRKRYTEDESICDTCGKNFHVPSCYKKRGPNRGKYCSQKCRGIALSKEMNIKFEELRAQKAKEKETRKQKYLESHPQKEIHPCKFCGNETKKIFCNSTRYVSYKKQHAGETKIKKNCLNCGKDIIVRVGQHNAGYGKYCSFSCASIQRIKNNKRPSFGNSYGGKRADLNNRYFRSRWEANYARYLNVLIKQKAVTKWEYEAETFRFNGINKGTMSYLPDFKVWYKDGTIKFIEIKGYMNQKSATQLKRMKKYFPTVKVELVDSKKYRLLNRQLKNIIPNWEIDEKKKWRYK